MLRLYFTTFSASSELAKGRRLSAIKAGLLHVARGKDVTAVEKIEFLGRLGGAGS